MDAEALKQQQAPLKSAYRETPGKALITLRAKGSIDDSAIACKVETGRALAVAGLHPATGGSGLVALWALFWGRPRAPFWFALAFGLFYVGLAIVGQVSGHHLGLGLHPFDHPFHVLLGAPGLLAAAIEFYLARERKAAA